MSNRLALPLLLLLSSAPSFADDLDPKKAAQIQLDRERNMAEVKKKYGDKKLSEMSNDEKRALAKDTAEAEQKALDKNGVKAKEWSRYEVKMSSEDRQAAAKAKDEIVAKEKADAEQKAAAEAAKSGGDKGEIPIQKGFSEKNPTVVEEGKDAPPIVERGNGEGGGGDENAEGGGGDQNGAPAAKSGKSSKKSKK